MGNEIYEFISFSEKKNNLTGQDKKHCLLNDS